MQEFRLHYNKWHQKDFSFMVSNSEKKENERILKILKAQSGKRLLDLGCGKGSFCSAAFNNGLEVYGADFSEIALKDAKSYNAKINYILSDAESVPFKEGFFDYVVCLGSFEHFSNKGIVLQEINRVLKEDGKIFMFLPNSYFLGHIYMVLKTGLPPDEAGQQFSEDFDTKLGWENILEKDYFKVASIQKFNTIWASSKVSLFTKCIYNFLIKPFIPFNLSYAFGYLCIKK